jgi:ionotropic glutamate receptor
LVDSTGEVAGSISKDKLLKQPIWPGDTTNQPTKLRIGVPIRQGFVEFLKVDWLNPLTNKPSISGFSHDVFLAVLDALPFPLPYEFIPFMNENRTSNGSYDELLYQIKLQVYMLLLLLFQYIYIFMLIRKNHSCSTSFRRKTSGIYASNLAHIYKN